MKDMKKSLLALSLTLLMIFSTLPAMAQELPYDTYNYDYWGDIFRTPAAYVPKGSVLGTDLIWNGEELGTFAEPQDLCVAPDGTIYVADTNNHRIVVLDSTMTRVLNVVTGFDNAGLQDQFNKPTGVAVTADGDLYVADSLNRRIVALDAKGMLKRIIEIPAAASSQRLGTLSYTVGTWVEAENTADFARSVTVNGETWAVVNLPAGSPLTASDETGLTFTVVAEEPLLKPFQPQFRRSGATLALGEDKASLRYCDEKGEMIIASYDPIPNKDIFTHIGRLVKKLQGVAISMTKVANLNVKGVWIDEEGDLYAGGEKSITKLNPKGKLIRTFASFKDETGAQTSLTTISEFSVEDERLYIRDDENRIVVLDMDGDLQRIIRSNAIRVTDADGNKVALIKGYQGSEGREIVGIEVLEDKLLVGHDDGSVAVLDKQGNTIAILENDAVLHLDVSGAIAETTTVVRNGKTAERLSGLTGLIVQDDKLYTIGANNRVLAIENGAVVQAAQNNAVFITDRQGNRVSVMTGYEQEGEIIPFAQIDGVRGVALNYVCDGTKKGNQRVQRQIVILGSQNQLIVLNADNQVTRICKDPNSEVLEDGYVFTPLKVSVDYAGRVYCVAQNMFEGIMVFEANGEFTGFFGTIEVNISAWDKFWRNLATKVERSKQQLFIPTEFTGIDIDEEGFVYASNVDINGEQAVRRLNPKGQDVIRKGWNGNLGGDLQIDGASQYAGPSKIVDVVYREKGMYSLLDAKRGRIFTYDHEGNLLYVFGGIGSQEGTLTMSAAIEFAGDKILALDAKQASILIFGETEYGRLINEAVGLRFDGDESKAVTLWEKVLRMDENNELANIGIGKAYLSAGENELAMKYLKRGMSQDYYSIAFKRYRNEILKENIQWLLTCIVVLIAAVWMLVKVVLPRIKKQRERRM